MSRRKGRITRFEDGRAGPAEAVRWYRKVAEQGNDMAKQNLVRLGR